MTELDIPIDDDAPDAPSDDQALPNPYDDPDFDGNQVGEKSLASKVVGFFAAKVPEFATTSQTQNGAVKWERDESHKGGGGVGPWRMLCLGAVQTAWQTGGLYYSARKAYEAALKHGKIVHETNPEKIPLGAVVFSGCTQTTFGHIFVAGRRFRDGRRMFYTNDAIRSGYIDPVPLDWFPLHWGQNINGYTTELNDKALPYKKGDPPDKPAPKPPSEDTLSDKQVKQIIAHVDRVAAQIPSADTIAEAVLDHPINNKQPGLDKDLAGKSARDVEKATYRNSQKVAELEDQVTGLKAEVEALGSQQAAGFDSVQQALVQIVQQLQNQ